MRRGVLAFLVLFVVAAIVLVVRNRGDDSGGVAVGDRSGAERGSSGAAPLSGTSGDSTPSRDVSGAPTTEAPSRDAAPTRTDVRSTPRAIGRVVDSAGRGVAGALVRLLARPVGPFALAAPLGIETATGGDGSFTIDPLPAQTAMFAEVVAPRAVIARVAIAARESGDADLGTIALTDGIVLDARVVSAGDRSAVKNPRVWIARDPPEPGAVEILTADGSPVRPPDLVGDADGRVRFDRLDAITYRFRIAADGFAPADVRRAFLAARGTTLREWTIEMQRADGVLPGRVLGPDDRPVAGATIVAIATTRPEDTVFGPHRVTATSGADGRFDLRGLTASDYDVRATAAGLWQADDVTYRHGTDEIEVRMGAGAALAGRVVGPGKRPVATSLELRKDGGSAGFVQVRQVATGADGKFVAADLEPGTYRIAAMTDELAPAESASVEVRPGARASVELELAIGAVLSGRATRDGRPIPADAVLLPVDFSAARPNAEFDVLQPLHGKRGAAGDDGTFRLIGLPDGPFALRVSASDGGSRIVRGISVESGASIDLGDVDVPPAGAVDGVARDAVGRPLAEVEVVAFSETAGARVRRRTDAGGHFRFEALPALDFRFVVTPENQEIGSFWVTETAANVVAGKSTSIAIERKKRA